MANHFTGAILLLGAILVCSSTAFVQTTQAPQAGGARSPWKFYPTDRAVGDGGPAPKRDLSGTWAGPGSGSGIQRVSDMVTSEGRQSHSSSS